jgi:hypothetical protein
MATFRIDIIVPDHLARDVSAELHDQSDGGLLSETANQIADWYDEPHFGFSAELVYDPTMDPNSGVR